MKTKYKIGILADEICESMNIDFEELIQNKKLGEHNKKIIIVNINGFYDNIIKK